MNLIGDSPAEYEDQCFDGLNLQAGEIGHKEFSGCVFRRCSLLETSFWDCRFVDCGFEECDLSLVRVRDCTFSNTTFRDSRLVGINWTEASWPRRGLFKSIDMFRCAISHSTFMGLSLRCLQMVECVARGVDFAETDLSLADCRHTDFGESRFLHTNLTGADFTGATNYTIAAHLNVLKKTKFSLPEAIALLYGLDIILEE